MPRRLRVRVDLDLCQGHGLCQEEAPEVFRVVDRPGEYAQVEVLLEEPPESLREKVRAAERFCPNRVIAVEEIDSGDRLNLEEVGPMAIRHVNPDGLLKMPEAFSQLVTADTGKLVFVAGQGAFDADMKLVGAGDYRAQAAQAFRNLRTALAAVGAKPEHVVSSTMYVVNLHPAALEAFTQGMNEALDGKPFPPNASTLVGLQSLAFPGMLVEICATAVIPA